MFIKFGETIATLMLISPSLSYLSLNMELRYLFILSIDHVENCIVVRSDYHELGLAHIDAKVIFSPQLVDDVQDNLELLL